MERISGLKRAMIKTAIRKSFRAFGLDIIGFRRQEERCPAHFRDDKTYIIREVRPWTMKSVERTA
jgi:hypothetical protein